MSNIVIFGATSAIALGAARRWAELGNSLCLVGRDAERLKVVGDDLRIRGAARCVEVAGDAADISAHESIWSRCEAEFGGKVDTVLVAYGSLPDHEAVLLDPVAVCRSIQINFTSVVALLTRIVPVFERAGRGTIAVICSVAGDRGRQSNYIYGAAKGGLAVFLEGLRNRLASRGVHVLTIKPGFVDTPMTAHLRKGPLFASAEEVGRGIVQAVERCRDVVYLPWFWRPIMAMIRAVPEGIFKYLKL